MLEREIEKEILDWIKNGDRRSLMIEGVRQSGKTFIIRKALENAGADWAEFNLYDNKSLALGLADCRNNDELVAQLSLYTDKRLLRGKTIIFIDEVQRCEDIVTMIKFWCDEGQFRFILSGSLLGVSYKHITSVPVGYMKVLKMYPMSFREFLQIYNMTDELMKYLEDAFRNRTPVNEAIHRRLLDALRMYLVVGGMPQAVQEYKDSHDLRRVSDIQKQIVKFYKWDFTQYQEDEGRLYLSRIYDLIPAELKEQNKRFSFSAVKEGLAYGRCREDFLRLTNAGVALPVYNVKAPEAPLLLSEKSSLFKLFLSDVGLLTDIYGTEAKTAILNEKKDINAGALYENYAAQELYAAGFTPYFYNSKKMGELDFVIEYKGKILPLEIKSGKDYYRHSALNNVLSVEEYGIEEAFVFSEGNVEVDGRIIYYPIYMMMCLKEEVKLPQIEPFDFSKIPL